MLDVNMVNYIHSDLFYNNIGKLFKCIRKNIMNILYDKILSENNILVVYFNECNECLLTINSFKIQLLHTIPITSANNILISDHNLPILISPSSTFVLVLLLLCLMSIWLIIFIPIYFIII